MELLLATSERECCDDAEIFLLHHFGQDHEFPSITGRQVRMRLRLLRALKSVDAPPQYIWFSLCSWLHLCSEDITSQVEPGVSVSVESRRYFKWWVSHYEIIERRDGYNLLHPDYRSRTIRAYTTRQAAKIIGNLLRQSK